jgi:hypothetical protein
MPSASAVRERDGSPTYCDRGTGAASEPQPRVTVAVERLPYIFPGRKSLCLHDVLADAIRNDFGAG